MHDARPSKDKVKIGESWVLDMEVIRTVTVVFPREEGDITLRIEDMVYVPDLGVNVFSFDHRAQEQIVF